MAHSEDSANHVLRFCWGKKRGVGGTKRNIQFYESFMIDDVSYSLYDCVYLYEMDALEPYIGKIVKIWEQPDGKKKVKILWFFRPNELQNYLGDHTPLEREIFLATGEGVGLFNINPLEAIAGKCSVICTSKDERNRKPSNEELDMADYIFCHTFDVQSYKISEKIDDKIAGVEAKFLLNRKDNQQQSSISRFEEKYDSGKAGPSTPIPSPMSKLDPSQTLENKADDRTECAPASAKRDNAVVSELLAGQCPLYEKIHSKSENAFAKDKEEAVLISENHAEDNLNHGKNKSNLSLIDSKPSKKMRLDTSAEASNDTSLRNLKFEYSGDGSSKEFVHLHKESFGKKNDALVDNKSPEEKFIDARTDAMNDASSRKQKFESNGDDSLGEIVHLCKESSEKNGALGEKIISPKMKLTDAPAEALNDASSRKQKIGPDGHGSLKEIASLHKEFPEKRKLIEKKTILLDEPLKEALPMSIGNKKISDDVLEVTRRPDADRSKWFKGLPWEERMQKADEQGTLVFIENLDPLYTSSEVEDIIYHTLKQSCTARVIQQATFQNPNYGQAYAIFKTRDAADFAVSKINKGCIQLPNGSSLLCSKGMLKVAKSSMCGHLSVNKNKLQMREMKRAVSTSHCSQPNTIEYEMAMDWLFIQERSVRCLKALHKGQADELKEFKKRLKTK